MPGTSTSRTSTSPAERFARHLRTDEVDDRGAVEIAAQVLDALAHAHRIGIVHRDVKPSNILLEHSDEIAAKLLDFGLAQFDGADTLTAVGDVPGTLAYIAPERLGGDEATPASDVWAVGVLLWEALAGQHPFWGMPLQEVAIAIERGAPPLVTQRPDLPRRLLAAVDRALTSDPAARPHATTFASELRGAFRQPAKRRAATRAPRRTVDSSHCPVVRKPLTRSRRLRSRRRPRLSASPCFLSGHPCWRSRSSSQQRRRAPEPEARAGGRARRAALPVRKRRSQRSSRLWRIRRRLDRAHLARGQVRTAVHRRTATRTARCARSRPARGAAAPQPVSPRFAGLGGRARGGFRRRSRGEDGCRAGRLGDRRRDGAVERHSQRSRRCSRPLPSPGSSVHSCRAPAVAPIRRRGGRNRPRRGHGRSRLGSGRDPPHRRRLGRRGSARSRISPVDSASGRVFPAV